MNESTSDDKGELKQDKVGDIVNFLNDDDGDVDDSPKKGEVKDKSEDKEDESETEDEENIELVEEDEDDDEDKADKDKEPKEGEDEEDSLIIPVKKSVILAKYPKLFKDFPILEKTYYGHQKYVEVFATPDDAREAAERVSILDKYESELVGEGNLVNVLTAVKDANPESFNKIADEYFESLGKVSPEAQFHVISGIAKGLIVNMIKTARSQGERGEPLAEAAHIINQYLFNSDQFEPQQKLSKSNPESEEQQKLKKEREQFASEKYENARNTLNDKVGKTLRATINQNIDPKGSMSDYIRKNANNDVLNIVNSNIRQDRVFMKHLDKLWSNASSKNYHEDSLEQIRKAILSKARTLLPAALRSVRNEAFRGLDKTRTDKDRRGPLTPGRSSSESSNRGNKSDKEVNTKGMGTLSALNKLMGD